MASTIIYGPVQFDACRVVPKFNPIFDDASKKQYRHTEVTLNITAYINPDLNPAYDGEDITNMTLARIRSALATPRLSLQYWDGDFLVLESPTEENTTDVANGPIPGPLSVAEFHGSETALITWSVTTWIIECYTDEAGVAGDDSIVPPYTTNTWRTEDTIDEFHLTTRTTTGTITVRADALQNPDAFRYIAMPQLNPGFMRVSSRYTQTEDNLSLQYSYTDKEMYNLPPVPAIKWKGRRIASSTNPSGTMWMQEVRLTLWGDKKTSKADLIKAAATVAIGALNSNASNQRGSRLLGGSIEDSLDENMVEIVVRQAMVADGLKGTFYGLNSAGLLQVDLDHYSGEDQTQDPTPYDPGTNGTALLTMLAPALNDPCLNATPTTASLVATNYPAGLSTAPPATVTTVALLPNDDSAVDSQEGPNGIYTEYVLVSHYQFDQNSVVLPAVGSDIVSIGYLGNPTVLRVVDWHATRMDQTPTMPDPNVIDDNWEFLYADYGVSAPQMGGDQSTPTFSASGTYYYACIDPTLLTGLEAGVLPFVQQNYQNSIYSTFSKGIIDAGEDTYSDVPGGFDQNPAPDNPFDTGD